MFPVVETEPPLRRIAVVIRANAGPLALVAALLLASRISQIATYDPAVKGLTIAALAEVALTIAGHSLALLVGCWAVASGGRPSGFRGLGVLPPGRLGPFLGYAVIFNLWLMAISAILTHITLVLLDGQTALTAAALLGAVATATVLLMYLQLGFLFPDVAMTGQSSIVFAMALGLASARRVATALALPVLALILPHAILAALFYSQSGMAQAAASWPSLPGLATAAILAALGGAGTTACGAAMTILYRDLTQTLPEGAWR